ncbi:hypothetical protein, partial [Paenibacillus lactis]|uniref:hypothetical protein n=1 Tax=Paenibacillus lactis TaxID=228574 RepID=UPI0036AD3773
LVGLSTLQELQMFFYFYPRIKPSSTDFGFEPKNISINDTYCVCRAIRVCGAIIIEDTDARSILPVVRQEKEPKKI